MTFPNSREIAQLLATDPIVQQAQKRFPEVVSQLIETAFSLDQLERFAADHQALAQAVEQHMPPEAKADRTEVTQWVM